MIKNDLAEIVANCWNGIPGHFPCIRLDESIIMPDHFHGIVVIRHPPVGVGFPDPEFPKRDDLTKGRDDRAPTLGSIVAYFKYQTTKHINAFRHCGICKIWQRNFYDHIIRDEKSFYYIRHYIKNNPSNWQINAESHLENEIREFERRDTVELEQSKFSRVGKTVENCRFGEKPIL